jgi:hypothetical protein
MDAATRNAALDTYARRLRSIQDEPAIEVGRY